MVPLAANAAPKESFLTRKVAKVPVIGWIAIAAVAVVGVIAAVTLTGGDDDESVAIEITVPTTTLAPATTPPPTTEVAATTPPTTVPETTAPATTEPATTVPSTGDGGTPETAIPIGDPSVAVFTYETPYSESAWEGSIIAISKGTAYDPADGTCLTVFATLTPTAVEGLVSYGYDTPSMSLIIDGEEQEPFGSCEYEEIESAGWVSIYDTRGTVGTEFPVYIDFQVPDSTDFNDLLLAVGSEDTSRTYFRGAATDAPQPTFKPGAPLGATLSPIGDGAVYAYEDPFQSSEWEFTYDGLVSVGVDSFASEPGVCFAAVGTIRPTRVGGVVSSGYDAPSIGVVADGRYFEGGFSDCDDAAGVLAGRDDLFEAAVTPGTLFPYYSEIFIPDRFAGAMEAVLVGDSGYGDTVFTFGPNVAAAAPAVTPTPGNPVGGNQLPVGTVVNTGDDGLGEAWDVVIRGLIELAPTPEGRCFAIVGIATPTSSDEATAQGFSIPTMTIVVDGRQVSESYGSCDLSAIEAAGYGDYFNADVPVGTPYAFYVRFAIPPTNTAAPEVVLVGEGSFEVPPLVQATILPEIPPI